MQNPKTLTGKTIFENMKKFTHTIVLFIYTTHEKRSGSLLEALIVALIVLKH